jgi:hypothetical protein
MARKTADDNFDPRDPSDIEGELRQLADPSGVKRELRALDPMGVIGMPDALAEGQHPQELLDRMRAGQSTDRDNEYV